MFNLNLLNIFDEDKLFESRVVSLSTDSRTYNGEEVFFCLTGDSFDGFNFIDEVLEKKCEVVIFKNTDQNLIKMEDISTKYGEVTFIGVDSPLGALQELAKARIHEFKKHGGYVFGITGSNGKTTTKEMLTQLLRSTFGDEVHSTKGNFNNHIGVPLTILSAGSNCKYMIVEMGSNHLGEIRALSEIAEPEYGIISSVGAAHIGLFGNIDNIFKEKKSLFDYVKENNQGRSKFVVNGDDSYLGKIPKDDILIKFGNEEEYSPAFSSDEVRVSESIVIKNVNIHEKYNLNNLISALLLSLSVFPENTDKFIQAANEYKIPSLNRSEWIEKNEKKIFLDAYNANPTSMESSLNSFIDNMAKSNISLEETLFVLGDMNELGKYTEGEHKRIGEILNSKKAKHVAFVGNFSSYYSLGFESDHVYSKKVELEAAWPELSKNCKAIFIKASRSLQLESLIDIT